MVCALSTIRANPGVLTMGVPSLYIPVKEMGSYIESEPKKVIDIVFLPIP
jgi:hypothetical protein